MSKYRTSVVIGRWQTPYLHEGHRHLIDSAINEEGIDTTMIIIGCTKDNVRDERNPYTFQQRAEMIKEAYPHVLIGYVEDVADDVDWSREIDYMLMDLRQPILMGSRDSFISHYKGYFPYKHIEEIPGISATQIRNQLKNK